MAKFTIIYRRTIQTKKYHTTTIGLSQEFDTADTTLDKAFDEVRIQVAFWLVEERERLDREG